MAKPVVYGLAAEAVADIGDGATIMFGGFNVNLGAPKVLLRALMDDNAARRLTFIGNGVPQLPPPAPGEPFEAFETSRVRKVICSFPVGGSTRRGGVSTFEDAFAEGAVELELVPQGTLAERIRAGGAGIPAFYTPAGAGTRFSEGKDVRDFDGRQCVLERWLRADFALVKALKADRLGNLVYRYTARNFNPLMAMAADITIAEVSEIVEPSDLGPEEIVTPGIFVDRLLVTNEGGSG
jgi:3-oxoadipate CoA-transferase alpha subunit